MYPTLVTKSTVYESNYEDDMFESVKILVAIPPSTRNIVLVGRANDIEVRIVSKVNGRLHNDKTYKAIAQDVNDEEMVSRTRGMVNAAEMDSKGIAWVVFECYDKLTWSLRRRQLGGTFGPTTPIDLLRYILTKTMLADRLSKKDHGYSINYHGEEQKEWESITIEEPTNFLDVADYIQNHYGIYSRGLGIFLFDRRWMIFRPYDPDKFSEAGKRLIIYNVPADEATSLERNFYTKGDLCYIAATGESTLESSKTDMAVNEGTGVRFSDVRSLEYKMLSETVDGNERDPELYLSEVNPNTSGLGSHAPIIKGGYSDNPRKLSSDLYRRKGRILTLKWENGITDCLEPGMGIQVIYPTSDGIGKVNGTLLAHTAYSEVIGNGFNEKVHGTVISLVVMVF